MGYSSSCGQRSQPRLDWCFACGSACRSNLASTFSWKQIRVAWRKLHEMGSELWCWNARKWRLQKIQIQRRGKCTINVCSWFCYLAKNVDCFSRRIISNFQFLILLKIFYFDSSQIRPFCLVLIKFWKGKWSSSFKANWSLENFKFFPSWNFEIFCHEVISINELVFLKKIRQNKGQKVE